MPCGTQHESRCLGGQSQLQGQQQQPGKAGRPDSERRGRTAIAVGLPTDDDSAGLAEYADVVVEAIGDGPPVVLVAQSLGGFTAPLVCERVTVELLILVNAMVPASGETFNEWWTATGWTDEVGEVDMEHAFFHDVPADVKAEAMKEEPPQSATPLGEPWPLERWPDVRTRFVQGRDDRLFTLEFQRRVARERLSDRVALTGALAQKDVLPHYARASIFVLMAQPEWHWGVPNVVVEALAAGEAVVTTRFGSVEELVRDGETGLLVPPRDPGALAAALRRLDEDEPLRARLAATGRAAVARDYDLDRTAAWYVARFAEVRR